MAKKAKGGSWGIDPDKKPVPKVDLFGRLKKLEETLDEINGKQRKKDRYGS